MAIEGLLSVPQAEAPVVDIADQAAVSVELMRQLGVVGDFDRLYETTKADYQKLVSTPGITGRPIIEVPYSVHPTEELVDRADRIVSVEGQTYPRRYMYEQLWVPGRTGGSYTNSELAAASPADYEARLALYNPDNPGERLLHFLNMPYDQKCANGARTQLQAIEEAALEFVATHPDRTMQALGHRAVLLIAMEQRIKGEAMPLEWGFMRDATLPRKTVDGDSVVGVVDSGGGQLDLHWSNGNAVPSVGVGRSMGLKEL